MKRLAVALLLLLPACAEPEPEYPRGAVHIVNVTGGNGSGVMIRKFLMLTAAHVVGDGAGITVGHKKLPAKLLHKDEKADIALLHVAVDCPCVDLAEVPAKDAKALLIGYPVNNHVHMQIATVGGIQGVLENRMQLTVPAVGGNSGGGVFVLQEGRWKLAGILVQIAGWCIDFACYPVPHLSIAVDTTTMRQFVDKAEKV
jgi:hypothetical protein